MSTHTIQKNHWSANAPPECFPVYWGHELSALVIERTKKLAIGSENSDDATIRRWHQRNNKEKRAIATVVAIMLTLEHREDIQTISDFAAKIRTGRSAKGPD